MLTEDLPKPIMFVYLTMEVVGLAVGAFLLSPAVSVAAPAAARS